MKKSILAALLFSLFLPAALKAGMVGPTQTGLTVTTADDRYVNTTGDTMTGALNGTSAVFTSSMTAAQIVLTTGLKGITWADGSVSTTAPQGAAAISGLTAGTIPKASAANALTNSVIAENSGGILIGSIVSPYEPLNIRSVRQGGGIVIWSTSTTTGDYGGIKFKNTSSDNSDSNYSAMVAGHRLNGLSFWESGPTQTTLSERMRIYDGKVGVGTSAPAYAFHVVANGPSIGVFRSTASDTAAAVLVGNTGADMALRVGTTGDAIIYSDTGKALSLGANGNSEKVRITSAGRMGVGVATPDQLLTVAGSVSATGQIISSGTGSNYFAGKVGVGLSASSPLSQIDVYENADTTVTIRTTSNKKSRLWLTDGQITSSSYGYGWQYDGAAGNLDLVNRYGTTSDSVKMTILGSSGKVGISSVAPTAQLTVQAGSSIAPNDYVVKASSQNATLLFGVHGNGHWSVNGGGVTLGTCANGTLTAGSSATLGEVTFSGANSTCAINFTSNYDATPICFLTTHSAGLVGAEVSAESTSSFTFVPRTGAYGLGDGVHYHCMGLN